MSNKAPMLSEDDLIRSVCKESFYQFVQEFWSTVIATKPVWNWHIPYLCAELQKVAERVFTKTPRKNDLVINIPPGTTKSTICSVMFPAWVWTRMPEAQFICGSHTSLVALDHARRCVDILTSDKFKRIFGDLIGTPNPASSLFHSQAGGFRLAVGAGNVTGFHGHFIIVDDPINPESTESEADREKALRWMTSTLSTRKIDKEVTVTILIMQRLHQADPAALMLGQIPGKEWGSPVRHICLPWHISDKINPPALRAYYGKQGLLDPVRLPDKVAKEFKMKLGELAFAGQFDQHPVPPSGGMFKTDRLRFGIPPTRFRKVVRYWDKAATEDAGCPTVGLKLGETINGDQLWVLDVNRGRWDTDVREREMRKTAELDGHTVTIGLEEEPGSGGKDSARFTIRRTLKGFHVIADRPTGDKTTRAGPISTQVNEGIVYIACEPDPSSSTGYKAPKWAQPFIEELQFFPLSTYKDQTDAFSGAYKMLTGTNVVGALRIPANRD